MILTPEAIDFFAKIEDIVWEVDCSYIESIVLFCERNNMEIESVIPLIKNNPKFKSILQEEGELLNMLPKITRLEL